ncbi:MAG TPA: glycosyltransferase [Chthoniobacterales bacterium]
MNPSSFEPTERFQSKLHFLFATWEGGGNIPPAISVARKLARKGHRVSFMSDSCSRAAAEAAGLEFVSWEKAPNRADKTPATCPVRDWEATEPMGDIALLRDRIMFGPAGLYARDVLKFTACERPDLIVSSEMLPGVLLAAEAGGTPCVMLGGNVSFVPIPGIPPLGPGLAPARNEEERAQHAAIEQHTAEFFNAGLPDLNAARASLGLAPLADVAGQFRAASHYLLATSPSFDFPADFLPPHIDYVGPQLEDPDWARAWDSPWSADDPRPLVLVAFSTTFMDHGDTIRETLQALARLPVRGLATLGPGMAGESFPVPANVHLCASAPHSLLLRSASAVITHAGHGTTIRSLAAGVPLLCLPMGRDQNDNAIRVTARGAGISLSRHAPAEEIERAMRELLTEPSYRKAAQALGAAIVRDAERLDAASRIEDLAYETLTLRPNEPLAAGIA